MAKEIERELYGYYSSHSENPGEFIQGSFIHKDDEVGLETGVDGLEDLYLSPSKPGKDPDFYLAEAKIIDQDKPSRVILSFDKYQKIEPNPSCVYVRLYR